MFENRMLRRIFGPKWDEVTGGGGGVDHILENSVICIPHKILFG